MISKLSNYMAYSVSNAQLKVFNEFYKFLMELYSNLHTIAQNEY